MLQNWGYVATSCCENGAAQLRPTPVVSFEIVNMALVISLGAIWNFLNQFEFCYSIKNILLHFYKNSICHQRLRLKNSPRVSSTNKVVVRCPRRCTYIIFIARTRPAVCSLLTYCTRGSWPLKYNYWCTFCKECSSVFLFCRCFCS